jgi:hypothetical protein
MYLASLLPYLTYNDVKRLNEPLIIHFNKDHYNVTLDERHKKFYFNNNTNNNDIFPTWWKSLSHLTSSPTTSSENTPALTNPRSSLSHQNNTITHSSSSNKVNKTHQHHRPLTPYLKTFIHSLLSRHFICTTLLRPSPHSSTTHAHIIMPNTLRRGHEAYMPLVLSAVNSLFEWSILAHNDFIFTERSEGRLVQAIPVNVSHDHGTEIQYDVIMRNEFIRTLTEYTKNSKIAQNRLYFLLFQQLHLGIRYGDEYCTPLTYRYCDLNGVYNHRANMVGEY